MSIDPVAKAEALAAKALQKSADQKARVRNESPILADLLNKTIELFGPLDSIEVMIKGETVYKQVRKPREERPRWNGKMRAYR